MNSVLKVVNSALRVLILGWVEVHVYDKYKAALMSDPCHRIALVRSDTRAVFLFYYIQVLSLTILISTVCILMLF
jgi:hypothetical protein